MEKLKGQNGDFLLGRRRTIKYKRKDIKVLALRGTDGIFVDEEGRLYVRRWKEKEEPAQTPLQRAREIWGPDDMDYALFSGGVVSAVRGRYLAQFGAASKRLPTLNKILYVFESPVRQEIISEGLFHWEKMPCDLKQEILRAGYAFRRAHKPGLKEGYHQIYFLVKSAQGGRPNVGAALARTTAITSRVREELVSKYSWMPKFSAQEQALMAIQDRFDFLLVRMEKENKILGRHGAFVRYKTTATQQKLLEDRMVAAAKALKPYSSLRPFGRWIEFISADLDRAAEEVKRGRLETAAALRDRISVSFEIKKEQRKMDEFLLAVGRDGILGLWREDAYRQWLGATIERFAALEGKEARVNFVEPVCALVIIFLEQAAPFIALKDRKQFKGAIEQADALL